MEFVSVSAMRQVVALTLHGQDRIYMAVNDERIVTASLSEVSGEIEIGALSDFRSKTPYVLDLALYSNNRNLTGEWLLIYHRPKRDW